MDGTTTRQLRPGINVAEAEKDLLEIIRTKLSLKEVPLTLDSNLTELGADSLDLADVVMAAEEKFDIILDRHPVTTDEYGPQMTGRCLLDACCYTSSES